MWYTETDKSGDTKGEEIMTSNAALRRRKNRFRIISVILCICFSLAGCANGTGGKPVEPGSVEKTVEEIAVDYGTYGDQAADRIGDLLDEIRKAAAGS